MSPRSAELLHGTLDVLILKALSDAPRHGYDIVRFITTTTGDAVVIEDGSLYPALYRLEKKAHIRGAWGISTAGRRARFYELTPAGRKALKIQTRDWAAFAAGVSQLLLGVREPEA
jgi:PadR family transcriptional regulator PadR